MKLIDKSALVAEIERLGEKNNESENVYDFGTEHALKSILSFIDTLEVKGVDLEKIINDYFKGWKFDNELDIMVKPNNYSASFTDLKEIAKDFFELGLNAQKGE